MNHIVLHLITYLSPVISALACICLLLMYGRVEERGNYNHLRRILTGYYVSFAIVWGSACIYLFFPVFFVYVNSLAYVFYLLVQVTLYHFTYTLTRLEDDKRFSFIHYLIPVLFGLILLAWSFFVPKEAHLHIPLTHGKAAEGYEAFTFFSNSKQPVRLIYTLIYVLLSIRRLLCYRRAVVNFSADEGRNEMRWLYITFLLSLVLLIPPLMVIIFSRNEVITTSMALFPVFIYFILHAVLCYNMLAGNYVIIFFQDNNSKAVLPDIPLIKRKGLVLDKDIFEWYIHTARPYLKTDLKITDLVLPLNTNRTYLSNFINKTYGMSFSHLINEYRLQQLDYLLNNPDYSKYSNMDLIIKAGFGSYHSYLRAKQNHNKVTTLLPDG